MKKHVMKLFVGVIVLIAAVCLCAFASARIVGQGSCGPNATWKIDDAGLLTISGNGTMTSHEWTDLYFNSEEVTVKKVIICDGIENIGYQAFTNCWDMSSISIPGSVKTIEDNAFYRCTGLTTIKLPGKLTKIGNDAFVHCENLSGIVIPNSVTSIGDFAFNNCYALTSFTLPSSVKEIGKSVFSGCIALKTFKFNDTMTVVPETIFYDCSRLTSVTLPAKVKKILYGAFRGCSKLKSISIPDSVVEIERLAFYNCESLSSIKLPASLQTLGDRVFEACRNLSSVTVPLGLSSIGKDVFQDCTSLRKITVPARNTYAIQWFKDNGLEKALDITKIKIADCIFPEVKDQVYTGKEIKPDVKVSARDGKNTVVLVRDKDYAVSYKNNKNVGIATIEITGKGVYTGTKVLRFTINPKPTRFVSVVSKAKKQMQLTWKKGSGIKGYEIEYSLKKDFKNAKTIKISKPGTVKKSVKRLKSGKKYYIRIRTWKKVNGVVYYSAWSKIKKLKIK